MPKAKRKPSAAAKVRAALDAELPKPSDDVAPLVERRRSAAEQARPPPPLRLLSRKEVCERLGGISYPTIWEWMRNGRFPKARVLNGGKLGWIESEVEAWILAQPLQELKPADEDAAR
jgi:predicted DNA-binding transcriptional regulator AlpA